MTYPTQTHTMIDEEGKVNGDLPYTHTTDDRKEEEERVRKLTYPTQTYRDREEDRRVRELK